MGKKDLEAYNHVVNLENQFKRLFEITKIQEDCISKIREIIGIGGFDLEDSATIGGDYLKELKIKADETIKAVKDLKRIKNDSN